SIVDEDAVVGFRYIEAFLHRLGSSPQNMVVLVAELVNTQLLLRAIVPFLDGIADRAIDGNRIDRLFGLASRQAPRMAEFDVGPAVTEDNRLLSLSGILDNQLLGPLELGRQVRGLVTTDDLSPLSTIVALDVIQHEV